MPLMLVAPWLALTNYPSGIKDQLQSVLVHDGCIWSVRELNSDSSYPLRGR
jgi:hypothetical protein